MKKVFSILLLIALLAGGMTACSQDTPTEVDIIHPAKGMGVSVFQVGIQSVRFYKSAVSVTADIPQGIDDRGTVFLLSGAA